MITVIKNFKIWYKRNNLCGLRDQLDVTLVLYLFLLYSLLDMFRATLCPSSGTDDLVVFFRCVAQVLPNGQTSSQQDLTAYTATGLQHT